MSQTLSKKIAVGKYLEVEVSVEVTPNEYVITASLLGKSGFADTFGYMMPKLAEHGWERTPWGTAACTVGTVWCDADGASDIKRMLVAVEQTAEEAIGIRGARLEEAERMLHWAEQDYLGL